MALLDHLWKTLILLVAAIITILRSTLTNRGRRNAQKQDPDSPNAMMVDPIDNATHVVDVNGPLERDSVTEITPDTLADDAEPTSPMPLATDCTLLYLRRAGHRNTLLNLQTR